MKMFNKDNIKKTFKSLFEPYKPNTQIIRSPDSSNKNSNDISGKELLEEKNKPDILYPQTKHKTSDATRRDYKKEFTKTFKTLTFSHSPYEVWQDFITMFACSISNSVDKTYYDERESLYLKLINKYNKDEQKIFPQLAAETVLALDDNLEQDFLGDIFMSLRLGNRSNGQFFTPYHICQLMADITIDSISEQVKKNGYFTIHDPCCGAGATLIAGIHAAKKQLEKDDLNFQNHILVVAQDIDMTVALMCYIQLSLLGIAGYVKIGNSLTDPISAGDTYENYWFTPMYFSNVWTIRRMLKGGKL